MSGPPTSRSLAVRRLAAYSLDWCVFALWAGAVLAAVLLAQGGEPEWTGDPWKSQAIGALFTTLPFAAYFTWCEMAPRGRTIGKKLLRLGVRRVDGTSPPSFGAALARTLVKLAPWELGHVAAHQFAAASARGEEPPGWALALASTACLAALGSVVMLFLPGGRAPHDRAAGTRIVRA